MDKRTFMALKWQQVANMVENARDDDEGGLGAIANAGTLLLAIDDMVDANSVAKLASVIEEHQGDGVEALSTMQADLGADWDDVVPDITPIA